MPDPKQLEALLRECAQGREPALAQIYSLCAPHLFPMAVRMLRRSDWAEEVMQDCFISIWQNASRYASEQSQPLTWMSRIVRNRCIDLLRRPDLERPDPDGAIQDAWADQAPGPLARLEAARDGKRLAGCMAELDAPQRQAIAMSFFDDLSHSEIAEKLASPLGTVKSWLRRGMERLKRCLS